MQAVGPALKDLPWDQGVHGEYSLTSLVQHSFIQHPRYYDTFLCDQTF